LDIFYEYRETIDLVISDLAMPGFGGIKLYEEMVKENSEIKMLFISGHPEDFVNQAPAEGLNFKWLAKPFSAQLLAITIQELLDGK
jgi:two-component system cell cycle sensor histidine kinase/response regulator CckA